MQNILSTFVRVEKISSFLIGGIFVFIFFVLFSFVPKAHAAVITSTTTGGNWATESTWVGGSVPANTDTAIIAATSATGVSIAANATIANVTVNSGAILSFPSNTSLTVNGTATVNGTVNGATGILKMNLNPSVLDGTGTINSTITIQQPTSVAATANLNTTATITLANTFTVSSGGVLTSTGITSKKKNINNNGTINLNGNYDSSAGASIWTQGTNAVVNITGVFTPTANITLTATASGNLVNYNGSAQTLEVTTYVNLTLSGNGAKTFPSGTTTVNGKLSMQRTATATVTGTLTPGAASSLEYKGSSAQTTGGEFISPWPGSGGVAIENASGVTLGAARSVGANPFTIGATVSNSVFNDSGFQLTATGTLNLTSGTFKLGSAGTATTFPTFGTKNISAGTTVEYAAGVAQTVSTTPNYSNLIFSGAGTKTTASGTVTVGGAWSVTGGTATLSTNNTSVTVSDGISGTGAITSGLGTISLAGNWTNSGTFTSDAGTVAYSNTTGGQTIAGLIYNNLTLSNAGGTDTAAGNISANGTLTTTAGGTLDMTAAFTLDGTLSTIANNGTIKTSAPTTTSSTPIASGKIWGGTVNYASSSGAQTLVAGTFTNFTQSGSAGSTLAGNVIISGVLTLSGGNITTSSNNIYVNSTGSVSRTSGQIVGNLRKFIATGATSKTFEIGDASNYVPVSVGFGNATVAGDLTASTAAGDHPNISTSDIDSTKSVNRYWTLTNSGVAFNNYSATFNFINPGDLDAGANTANFIVGQFNGSAWSDPTVGTKTSTGTQITGVTSFSDFQIGEAKSNPVPTATSIFPTSKTVGGAQFALTVNGTNFISGVSTVQFAGSNRTTIFVSATQLTATIPTTDLATAGTFNITVVNSAPGGGTSNAQTFTVNNPVPTITSISSTSATAGSAGFTLTVNGTNFIGVSTVKFNGTTKTTTFVSSTQVTAAILASDIATAGSFNVVVNNPTPGGGDSNAQTFTVLTAASKFVILAPGGNPTVDAPISVTIQAQKNDNSVDTTFNSAVTLNISDNATGGGVITITNGVGTASISDRIAETAHLSLTDSQNTGLSVTSTADVVFSVGAIAQFSLSHSGTLPAGTRIGFTVSRKDQFGNTVTSGSTTAFLYSNSTGANKKFYDATTAGNVISSVVIADGQSSANFWYYDETLGTWSVTASDNSTAPDGTVGLTDAVDSIAVVPGPVAQFILNHPGNMTAGTRLGFTVSRKDQFGNLVARGSTAAFLYSTSTSANKKFYDATTAGTTITSLAIANGQSSANFWYFDDTPGSYTITASDSAGSPDGLAGIADATQNVAVNAAPIVATRFVILPPSAGSVDASITITVEAQDNSANIDMTVTSGVTLVTSGSAIGGGLVTMVNGVGTIQISDHTAQTVSLTLNDTQRTGLDVSSSQNVVFSPGAVSQFLIDNPGNMSAGTRLGFIVTRKDQFGNLVAVGTTIAYLYSSSTSSSKNFYNAASGGSAITSVSIVNGQSTGQFWYYDEKAASVTLIVSDNATTPDGAAGIADASSQTFSVAPAIVSQFLLNNPGDMTVGTRQTYIVTREDRFGNLVTAGVQTVSLTSSAGNVAAFYESATSLIPVTAITFIEGQSITNFWYFNSLAGLWAIVAFDPTPNSTVQQATVSVQVIAAPIVATKIVIHPVGNALIGIPMTLRIDAEDDSGNVDTTVNNDVTLLASGSATGAGIVHLVGGIGSASINDDTAESVLLSLSDTQHTNLNVSSLITIVFFAPITTTTARGIAPAPTSTPAPIAAVDIAGNAFSGASLKVFSIGGTGTPATKQTTASADGTFSLSFVGGTPGVHAYVISAFDSNNRVTQIKILDADLADPNSLLNVKDILLSPTLGIVNSAVTKGGFLSVAGYANPNFDIELQIDNTPTVLQIKADGKGAYHALINTASFDYGSHTVRTRQISQGGQTSDFSPQQIFSVVNIFAPNLDFNSDGVVDIKDYSIFIARYLSKNASLHTLADINSDGKVDIQDLSIFLRSIKK